MTKTFFSRISWVLLLGLTACIGPGETSDMKTHGEDMFPEIKGINLLGDTKTVPQDLQGNPTILLIGFERHHQTPINQWFKLLDQITEKHPTLKVYELPVIRKVNPLYRWWINNGMRRGVKGEQARKRTITLYTDVKAFGERLSLNREKVAILLLDPSGRILFSSQESPSMALVQTLASKFPNRTVSPST